ncbi:MAG: hypothetical protein NTW85_00365 [Methylococcales bacterium]|nr:hypothetical protein [Methylococcales bacterium]
MDKNTLDELRQLVNEVMYAPTKKDAQHPLKLLKFKASGLKGLINNPYLSGKLGTVINYATEASGRVKDKEHWISCVEKHWYVFENGIKHDIQG